MNDRNPQRTTARVVPAIKPFDYDVPKSRKPGNVSRRASAAVQVRKPEEAAPDAVWIIREIEDGETRHFGPVSASIARFVWDVVDPTQWLSRRIHRLTVAEVAAISVRAASVCRTKAKRTRVERKLASDVRRLLLSLGEARSEVSRMRRAKTKSSSADDVAPAIASGASE